MNAIINDITKKSVLGRIQGYVYVIEYQQRGMPHAHICVILEDSCKPSDPSELDKMIFAEIPKCRFADEICKQQETRKKFQKILSKLKRKLKNMDGYVQKDYYINVEYCGSIKAIKYLYKYMMKGKDRAQMTVSKQSSNNYKEEDVDIHENEILTYKRGRLISANEAHYTLEKGGVTEMTPIVRRLGYYIPSKRKVLIDIDKSLLENEESIEKNLKNHEMYQWMERNKLERENYEEFFGDLLAKEKRLMNEFLLDQEQMTEEEIEIGLKKIKSEIYLESEEISKIMLHEKKKEKKRDFFLKRPFAFEMRYVDFPFYYTYSGTKNN